MEEATIAIESIFAIPRNQFHWGYKINEGVLHTIKKERLFEFLKERVSQKNYALLADLISRFIPFIILVKEDKIIELKKQKIDSNFYREKIFEELISVTSEKSQFARTNTTNDEKLKKLNKKVKKMSII